MEPSEQEIEILRRMTPTKKMAVLGSLIRQAHTLKEARIRALNPAMTSEEVSRRAWELVGGGRP